MGRKLIYGLSPKKTYRWPIQETMFNFATYSVQFSCSVVSNSLRPHESQHAKASLSIINSRSSLRLMSIESVMLSSHLILCRPLLLLPPIPASITVFANESTHHMRCPKYWSFSFSIRVGNSVSQNIELSLDQVLEVIWLTLLYNLTNSNYLFLLYSCFHVINVSENGLLLRFGQKLQKLEPKQAISAGPRENFV